MIDHLFRIYEPEECGKDGYPHAWHGLDEDQDIFAIKNLVRAEAGNRCVRCGHPYEKGMGEWSPCNSTCSHGGPVRYRWTPGGDWSNTHLSGDRWGYGDTHDVGWSIREGQLAEAEVEAQWRILTVHHLNGVKADCRWFNLIAACQRCHLNIQRRVKMDRPWPWPHSDWFKPYAAAFYASKFLGEELTREETEARMDELLALGATESAIERMPL